MANKPLQSIKFPGLSDTYTVPQIDSTLAVQGKAADAKAAGDKIAAVSAMTAEAFSTSTAYAVGDHVTYNGALYVFTTAHSAGAWNSSHVSAVTVEGELTNLKDDLSLLGETGELPVLANKTFTGTRNLKYVISLSTGKYRLILDGITSSDIDAEISSILFYHDSSLVLRLDLERNKNIDLVFELEDEITSFYLMASRDAPTSSGDTFTYQNLSILKILTDSTLKKEGVPADAKAVGDSIETVNDAISGLEYDTVKSRGIVTSGSNMDDYRTPGVFSVTTDAIAQSMQNLPVTIACDFIVFNSKCGNTTYGYGDSQIVLAQEDLYFRVYKNSRWFGWVRLENYANVKWFENSLKHFNQFNLMKNIGKPYHTDRTNNGIHFLNTLSEAYLIWTFNGTATDTATATVFVGQMSELGLVAGNVYYFNMDECPSGASWSFRFGSASGNKFIEFTHSNYLVVPSNVTGDVLIQIIVANGSTYDNVSFSMPQLTPVDLSTLDEFQTWFLRGVILGDGSISSSETRIYTPDMMEFDSNTVISFDGTRSVQIMYYDENSAFITDRNTYGWMDGPNYVVINAGDRFKLNVKLIPNAEQSNEQITETLEHVHIYSLKKKLREDYANYEDDWASLSMYQTISVIGDSYASGPSNNYPMSWGQMMARDIGATLINLSHGGAYTKTWLTNSNWGLAKMLSDPAQQLYICAMGINDYTRIKNNEYTLGTIADINDASPSSNPDTFYGNYGKIISNIKSHAPNASIVMLSVARPYERVLDPNIKEIAEHFDIPYIYLPDDWFFRSQYFRDTMYSDHPRVYGYGGMAKAIRRLLEKTIKTNQDYFSNYAG